MENLNVENSPSVTVCKSGTFFQFNASISIVLRKQLVSRGWMSALLRVGLLHGAGSLSEALAAMPPVLSCSATFTCASGTSCSTVRTWLLSQVSSRRAKTRCIYTSGWCLAISLTRGRKAVVTLCDKINLPCQVDLPHFHSKHHCLLPEQFLDARTSPSVLVSSLSEHSNSHRTSRPDICKTGSFGIKLQTQHLRKVIFQLSHPLLTSYSGCCYVLCPSKNQIASWAVASMRVSGDLSHLSVKVLLSRHRWKAWSFAFFLQQENFSHHFSTCHSRTKLWPIPSYLPFWGTEGFFKDPFWISFQKSNSNFLTSHCWLEKKSIVILTSLSHGYRVISIYIFSECNFHPHWLCVSSS